MVAYKSITELHEAYLRGERPNLQFVHHALARGVEMGEQLDLDPGEIRRAMTDPDQISYSHKHESVYLRAGRCTLSVCIGKKSLVPAVITILWTDKDTWLRSYEKPVAVGRERRF